MCVNYMYKINEICVLPIKKRIKMDYYVGKTETDKIKYLNDETTEKSW